MEQNFTIYTKENCTYCTQAKLLLRNKNHQYEELVYPTDIDIHTLQERVNAAGSSVQVRSVPQIFHGNKYIGGFRELQQYLNK